MNLKNGILTGLVICIIVGVLLSFSGCVQSVAENNARAIQAQAALVEAQADARQKDAATNAVYEDTKAAHNYTYIPWLLVALLFALNVATVIVVIDMQRRYIAILQEQVKNDSGDAG